MRKRAHPALLVELSSEYNERTFHFALTLTLFVRMKIFSFSLLTSSSYDSSLSYIADAGGDYIDVKTDKWSSGGYRMDCMDKGSHTGWQCWASCSPFANPNFMDWGYLTFEVRVSGVFDDVCKPSISITKRWPSYGSNVVALGKSEILKQFNFDSIIWM